jgi:hypothetical protein
MFKEIHRVLRTLAGALAALAFALGAAAVTGLSLLTGGLPPGLAAAGALVVPVASLGAIAAAVGSSARPGPAAIAATLSVAHAVLPVQSGT